jgi:RNA polymerase sigma-70 factor (ECF subfamily)
MAKSDLHSYIKELQKGNMTAFDPLYYETKNLVYYTILNIVKDPSLSEDLMQETYLKALEKIHTFKTNTSVTSWFTTIARNMAINEFNRRKRELSIDVNDQEELFGSQESTSEKELLVREILQNLEDTDRDIVVYHLINDLKFRQIADILDMPLGTVTWRYNQAIKNIQSKYESR